MSSPGARPIRGEPPYPAWFFRVLKKYYDNNDTPQGEDFDEDISDLEEPVKKPKKEKPSNKRRKLDQVDEEDASGNDENDEDDADDENWDEDEYDFDPYSDSEYNSVSESRAPVPWLSVTTK